MVPADKNTGLAIGNLVSFEMGGLDDDEQLVAIDFDFGHLFAIEGIFYRQWMEIEHRLEACHFIGCRVGNADPGKFAVGLLERVARQGEFFGALAEPIIEAGKHCCKSEVR